MRPALASTSRFASVSNSSSTTGGGGDAIRTRFADILGVSTGTGDALRFLLFSTCILVVVAIQDAHLYNSLTADDPKLVQAITPHLLRQYLDFSANYEASSPDSSFRSKLWSFSRGGVSPKNNHIHYHPLYTTYLYYQHPKENRESIKQSPLRGC